MRRLMLLLSLIAAFAGTPLRLAEAAEDLERILTDSGVDGEIETTDGGVGDDSGVTVRPVVAHAPTASGLAYTPPMLFQLAVCPSDLVNRPLAVASTPPPTSARRHCALLQRFLC